MQDLFANFLVYQLSPDSSFVPPFIYTVLGSSRHIGIGPVSIGSLVMGSMLEEVVSSTEEKDLYLRLAFTSTLFAGLFQAALGLFRYGTTNVLFSEMN